MQVPRWTELSRFDSNITMSLKNNIKFSLLDLTNVNFVDERELYTTRLSLNTIALSRFTKKQLKEHVLGH